MARIIKNRFNQENFEHKAVCKIKIWKFIKNFLGMTYKKKKKVPIKKTTKSHHRLRNTWILQFLTFCVEWNCKNMISIDETAWRKVMNRDKSWSVKG